MKALLCDFDGTIVNTLWLYPKAYRVALEKFGFDFSDRWIYEHCFGRTEGAICKELGISENVDEFKKIYFNATDSFSLQSKLFPGVIEVMNAAKEKKIKLAIISFAYRWYLDRMLTSLQIKDYFDVVIGFEDVTHPKPAPDAVVKSCKELGVSASESLVIGDSVNDILMGKSAEAKTALFLPVEHKGIYDFNFLKQSNPDYIISDWNQLKSYI